MYAICAAGSTQNATKVSGGKIRPAASSGGKIHHPSYHLDPSLLPFSLCNSCSHSLCPSLILSSSPLTLASDLCGIAKNIGFKFPLTASECSSNISERCRSPTMCSVVGPILQDKAIKIPWRGSQSLFLSRFLLKDLSDKSWKFFVWLLLKRLLLAAAMTLTMGASNSLAGITFMQLLSR